MSEPYADSWMELVLDKAKMLAREPEIQSAATSVRLANLYVHGAVQGLNEALVRASKNKVVCVHRVTLVDGQQHYTLPPHMARVHMVGQRETDYGLARSDIRPRTLSHPGGQGWAVDGNVLTLTPIPKVAADYIEGGYLDVWYTPTGEVLLHQGLGTTLSGSPRQLLMPVTPAFGRKSFFDDGYAGCLLHLFGPTLATHQIIRIESSTNTALNLRTDISDDGMTLGEGSQLQYEILPPHGYCVWDVIAHMVAMSLVASKKNTSQYALIRQGLTNAVAAVRSVATNLNARTPQGFRSDTLEGVVTKTTPNYWVY